MIYWVIFAPRKTAFSLREKKNETFSWLGKIDKTHKWQWLTKKEQEWKSVIQITNSELKKLAKFFNIRKPVRFLFKLKYNIFHWKQNLFGKITPVGVDLYTRSIQLDHVNTKKNSCVDNVEIVEPLTSLLSRCITKAHLHSQVVRNYSWWEL